MHRCGWTHGDISVGNILVVDESVKLSDLEYGESRDNASEHNGMVRNIFAISYELRIYYSLLYLACFLRTSRYRSFQHASLRGYSLLQ